MTTDCNEPVDYSMTDKADLDQNSNLPVSDATNKKKRNRMSSEDLKKLGEMYDTIQNGELPNIYRCKACSFSTPNIKNMKRHAKNVHMKIKRTTPEASSTPQMSEKDKDVKDPAGKVECTQCCRFFKNINSLKTHIGSKHKQAKKEEIQTNSTVEVTPMTAIKTELMDDEEIIDDFDDIPVSAVHDQASECVLKEEPTDTNQNEASDPPVVNGFFISVSERVKFKDQFKVLKI